MGFHQFSEGAIIFPKHTLVCLIDKASFGLNMVINIPLLFIIRGGGGMMLSGDNL